MNFLPERLMPMPEVNRTTRMSRAEVYRRMKRPLSEGGFPQPVKLGRASAWPESEVLAWVEARKAERNAA